MLFLQRKRRIADTQRSATPTHLRQNNVIIIINCTVVAPQQQLKHCSAAVKAVTRNLFRKCFSRPFSSFPSPLPSFSSLSPPQSGSSNPATRYGGALLTLPPAEEAIWVRLQKHFRVLSSKNVSGGCKCHPISAKRNLKKWSTCGCFWMLLCSRLLNSTWLFS